MKTKQVKFIRYHHLFAHDVGDEVHLNETDADSLIKSKHAISLERQVHTETATLPKAETATLTKKK